VRATPIVFGTDLEDAKNGDARIRRRGVTSLHWWYLIPIVAAAAILLYALFRWASAAPEIDEEIAKERFRVEQDWRSMRRAGNEVPPSSGTKEVKLPS
jgi:hypothetical protein